MAKLGDRALKDGALVFSDVFDAIEDDPGKAQLLKLRSDLMHAVNEHLDRAYRKEGGEVATPGLSRKRSVLLKRAKVSKFRFKDLVAIAAAVGLRIEMKISPLGLRPSEALNRNLAAVRDLMAAHSVQNPRIPAAESVEELRMICENYCEALQKLVLVYRE